MISCSRPRIPPLIVAIKSERQCACPMSPTCRIRWKIFRDAGLSTASRAVLMIIFRQPGANIIDTVDNVRELLPLLKASISPAIDLTLLSTARRRFALPCADIELTLVISVVLVILVVFVFLRNVWATHHSQHRRSAVAGRHFRRDVSLGYSLDNLSLMALTISTGFVVDDAIVVIENITRYLERVCRRCRLLPGAQEIGFTVLSMSTSLVAVFIPILLMGGIVGRLFREFAVTLSWPSWFPWWFR